jgi:hypothetical protein
MNYFVRIFWQSALVNCLKANEETCKLRDSVFCNGEKTVGDACAMLHPLPACLFNPAIIGIKWTDMNKKQWGSIFVPSAPWYPRQHCFVWRFSGFTHLSFWQEYYWDKGQYAILAAWNQQDKWRTLRKTCPSAIFLTKDLTRTGLGLEIEMNLYYIIIIIIIFFLVKRTQITKCAFIRKTNWLMLYKETNPACSENHMKNINTLYGQGAELLMLILVVCMSFKRLSIIRLLLQFTM